MNNFVASIKKVDQNFYFPANALNISWAVLYNYLRIACWSNLFSYCSCHLALHFV